MDQRTMRQKKSTMWRNSWPAFSIIHNFDLVAEDNDQRGHRKRDQRDGHQQQSAQPPSAKAPVLVRNLIGPAKTLHQRQHHAQAGKDAEAGGGQEQLARSKCGG